MKTIAALILLLLSLSFVRGQSISDERKIVQGISSDQYTEFSPTISADGKTIIFESSINDDKGWELFESQMDSKGQWSVPVPLKSINEKCNFLAGPSLSYDGNTLYYTAFIEGASKSEDIYFSERTGDNSWSEPVLIGAPISTEENYEGFPSVSSDGTTLYFIKQNLENDFDKKSKEPCFKIYSSKKQPDGSWSEPVALPSPVNLGCERDPKIMADNHTLIFSSIRKDGKGKFDMYQTARQRDGSWAEPIALDYVNSIESDQSPCISASGDLMYFYTGDDIYSTPIPERFRQMMNIVVQGRVLEDKSLKAVGAAIHVSNLKSGESYTVQNSEADGEYSLVLNTGTNYRIVFDNENYLPDTLSINLENQKTYELLRKNILLRTSYPANITVIDKDLKTKLSAWVNVEQGTESLYQDSLKTDQLPSLTLKASGYTVKSARVKYMPLEEKIDFKSIRLKSDRNILVKLEHEKVKFTTYAVNSTSRQKANVKVLYKNQNEDELLIAPSGEATALRRGDRYQVVTSSEEGYFFSTATIVAGEQESIELLILPIELNGLLTLNNITFKTNSAELMKSSLFELDRVMELMQVNPTLVVEVSAHTDDVGDDALNLKLSNKRAQSTLDYLILKGVGQSRLVPIGHGEAKPIAANDTDENRSKNRRVELRVLKIGQLTSN
ncbi:MAG TPA: OmpA family protein [Cyclobacteriaceae bacterium]